MNTIGIWCASLVLARWSVHLAKDLRGKVICELGSGCGASGVSAVVHGQPRKAYMLQRPTCGVCNFHTTFTRDRQPTPQPPTTTPNAFKTCLPIHYILRLLRATCVLFSRHTGSTIDSHYSSQVPHGPEPGDRGQLRLQCQVESEQLHIAAGTSPTPSWGSASCRSVARTSSTSGKLPAMTDIHTAFPKFLIAS